MAKKKFAKPKQAYNGFVYILKIFGPEGVVYKIGTTNRTPKVRMLEIAGELFEVLGHIPKIVLLKQEQTKDNYKVEAEILKDSEKYRCTLGICEWAGESELRRMEEHDLLNLYRDKITKDYPPIKTFEVGL